jgi:hypothetical protein
MAARRSIVFVLIAAVSSMGASWRTQNFIIEAPTQAIAQQAGQYAEEYRRQKALQWLGREMPAWNEPCPLRLTITMNGSGGATSFMFDRGAILSQEMHIEGSLERMLNSVLPHEITHTVFAYYYRQAMPRWADEGGSVLSEDDIERGRHDRLVREILYTPGQAIPLRRLFSITNYPRDPRAVMALYAEGYSVTNYLVGISGRQAFLQFVAQGMRGDWDSALRTNYRLNTVEELEAAWIASLRATRGQPAGVLASRDAPAAGDTAIVARQTLPPAQPILEAPRSTYRGQAPGPESDMTYNQRASVRPGYLPDYTPPQAPSYSPAGAAPAAPRVQLGAPQSPTAPTWQTPQPQSALPSQPGYGSPVGYSH